jgi:hypothetical protein
VPRLEAVTQHQGAANPRHLDLVVGIAVLVVPFDDRDLDGQQAALSGFAVEKAHWH